MLIQMVMHLWTVDASCGNSNPFRTIYSSNSFQTTGFQDAYSKYASKVTSFTSMAPQSTNWCTNNTDIFKTTPTEVCCSVQKLEFITYQFAGKWISGAAYFFPLRLKAGFTNQSVINDCVFDKTDTNYTKVDSALNDNDVNRSKFGVFYAVYKVIKAYMPYAQLLSCLICASDQTATNYYSSNTLKVEQNAYNSLINGLGSAFYDFQTNLNKVLQAVGKTALQTVMDQNKSSSKCNQTVMNSFYYYTFCSSATDCATKIKPVFQANTVLEFQTVGPAYSLNNVKIRRSLDQRVLASASSPDGVGVSNYKGIENTLTVNGYSISVLQAAWGYLIISVGLLLSIL